MPAADEDVLNGAQVNGQSNDSGKLRFDTIEDTIKAFSMFLYVPFPPVSPHQVMSTCIYVVGNE